MTLEYKLRTEGDETVCCDSCDSPAPTAEFQWAPGSGKHGRQSRPLCRFCSTTLTSRYTEYPQDDAYGQMRAEVWRANAALFNALTFGLDGPVAPQPES
jgi:hypothetical protein